MGWCYNQYLLSSKKAGFEEVDMLSSLWWGEIWAETWMMWTRHISKERVFSIEGIGGNSVFQVTEIPQAMMTGQSKQCGEDGKGWRQRGPDHVSFLLITGFMKGHLSNDLRQNQSDCSGEVCPVTQKLALMMTKPLKSRCTGRAQMKLFNENNLFYMRCIFKCIYATKFTN